jgi:hypothetical protein
MLRIVFPANTAWTLESEAKVIAASQGLMAKLLEAISGAPSMD